MDKRQLRKQVLAARDAMKPAERKRGDILVTERILGHQWYYSAEHILIFVSFGSEIDTGMLMEDAWHTGKKVYVPRVEDKQMSFHQIENLTQVKEGYRGIREPAAGAPVFSAGRERAADTLMLLPGVAFDRAGRRIGYGGGFYDRYLQDKPWMRTIAIGYRCQRLAEEFAEDKWDVRPGQVICL